MANWKYRVDLADLKDKYEDGEIDISELRDGVVERLEELKTKIKDSYYKELLQEITDSFICEVFDEKDFNNVMGDLFDWGDIETSPSKSTMKNRLCWIGLAF